MGSSHTKKAINLHHDQLNAARIRKVERRQQKQEADDAFRRAMRLQVEYYHLAQVGFALMWLAVTALIAISGFKIYG